MENGPYHGLPSYNTDARYKTSDSNMLKYHVFLFLVFTETGILILLILLNLLVFQMINIITPARNINSDSSIMSEFTFEILILKETVILILIISYER